MAEGRNPGEDKAWEILAAMNPEDVCRAAAVSYEAASKSYKIRSYGMEFYLSVNEKAISSAAPESSVLLQRLGYFFRLSVLWYLVNAKDIACTGRPMRLEHLKGGDFFTRGSHVLPLDAISKKYGKDKEGFIEKGTKLDGKIVNHGDVALLFFPLPRIPATLILWLEDDEFPARADLLFDSTCEMQIPLDIIWSVAMMTVLLMI